MGHYSVKKKKKSTIKIVLMTLLVMGIVLAVLGTVGYGFWLYQQPKFHDLTIELGTDTLGISDFMTKYAWSRTSAFVSDPNDIDLNKVGTTEVVFRQGKKQETVRLTIQDTTPPSATIPPEQTVPVDQEIKASDLVQDVKDMSKTKVYFVTEPELTPTYEDQKVTIVLEDACGNKTQGETTLSFRWMKESFVLELGDQLTKKDLLLNFEQDEALLEQEVLDNINEAPLGDYQVVSLCEGRENICAVTVQDTRGPEILVKNVYRREGQGVDQEAFVNEVQDPSGVKEVRLTGDYDIDTLGTYPVTLEAEDNLGNITTVDTNFIVSNDWVPPVLSGNFEAMTVERESEPDFLEGISAEDDLSEECTIEVDTSRLNMSKAGTYTITYIAKDDVGNETTMKRMVTVRHNAEDTKALVQTFADKLSDDPVKITDYVRYNLGYNSNWGGDDPVWYGFKNKTGNCYVHALCQKAIMDAKGIENQVIHTTDKTHYWLLVKFDDGWKHMDSTPGTLHSLYAKMNDKQRLATLSGRTWDTSLWPAAE